MAGANPSESPLDAIADTVGERTTEAFKVLSNETRLAILLALWDEYDPDAEDNAVPFSDLRAHVGMRDSGQFNYHLDKLVDTFVEQTEEGYALTTRAQQVLRTVLAGTLTEPTSFEGEPIDAECDRCGASMVVDYRDGILFERCTNCEARWGRFGGEELPQGTLRAVYRPPVGLESRTPQEFHRHGNTLDRYDAMTRLKASVRTVRVYHQLLGLRGPRHGGRNGLRTLRLVLGDSVTDRL